MKKLSNIILMAMLALVLAGCNLLTMFNDTVSDITDSDHTKDITALSFDCTTKSVNVGESEYIKLSISPEKYQNKCSVAWDFDSSMIKIQADNYGVVVSGVAAGGTYIKATCNGIVATCLLSVIATGDDAAENPYIYSNYSVVELQPGNSITVSSSLYGGSVSDMENFEWSIKDSSIADITFSRNNCVVTANKSGSTQLVCHHPNAAYDYTFVVYVYTDLLTEPYITTDYNVLTVNKNKDSSRTVSVDLINPLSSTYANGFSWSYADEGSRSVIELNANLNSAEIVPLSNGIAKIVVSHENAKYDLTIIVRVNTIVDNTYISVSTSSLVITGSESAYTVTASVENYSGYADPDGFKWTVPDGASECMDYSSSGNTFRIVGKKNGVFKVNVSHELSAYSRNVLVILEEQAGSAIDSSMYITTDENYVQTKVGADTTALNVRLVGGEAGDENNFVWFIDKGLNNGIATVEYVTGEVKDSSSRSATTSGTSAAGELRITPISAGNLDITITHPKSLYDCKVTVKVYSEYALLEEPVYIKADSVVKIVNGKDCTVTASMTKDGSDVTSSYSDGMAWASSDSSTVSVSATGNTAVLSAVGAGSSQTYVTVSHKDAYADKKILVLAADTEAALETMKCIYSDVSYLRLASGEEKTMSLSSYGLDATDIISWTSSDSSVCIVNADSSSTNHSSAVVSGVSSGVSKITASLSGASPVSFEVTVVPKGESSSVIQEPSYLTTNMNAVVIEKAEGTANLSVTGVNISSSDMALYTTWSMADVAAVENEPVFAIAGTGGDVLLTANKAGKSVITVANDKSSNALSINAKCGELYEWTDGYTVYITTNEDVVSVVKDDTYTIGCSLVNTTSTGSFSWEVTQGKDLIDITGLSSGTCSITALAAGQAVITVTNSLCEQGVTKEILVNIANSEEELHGYMYLTTSQNVISVGEGSNATVSVEIANSDSNIINGYTWRSSNTAVATVTGSGSIGVVYGIGCGSAKIIVENSECDYPLEMIVNVVDPIAASLDPYIACNNIVTCTVGDDAATIAAELVGGTDADVSGFTWSIVDSSIATLYASNDSAQVKAVSEGVTQIIISHQKASVDRTVLVICEAAVKTNCYITVTESIIKMSPSDSEKTVTATLVNGSSDDVYNFKWWADNYDIINMNYTGESCVIKPISSGSVTVHVSHPKAASTKDIILYISNYTDFAFETSSTTLTTGTDTFLNMEVPATGVDCEIAYSSTNNSVCTATGNTSVCSLHPGVVPSGSDTATCTIKAVLQTKAGVEQAAAELLVVVKKKDETKPYIAFNGSTIITMNKDEKRNLTAYLYGSNIVDTTYSGLKWKVANSNGTVADFTSSKDYGSQVQIRAVNSGSTTITITHSEASSPLTLYVVVTGVDDPTVALNYTELPLYIGEDTATITATVTNDTGEDLDWSVVNDSDSSAEQDFFTFTSNGNKASVYAKKAGTATVYCKIPSTGYTTSCKVKILEPESIQLFVYDDDSLSDASRTKYYVSTLRLYPGETKLLHYETVPSSEQIKSWVTTDSSYYTTSDKGYASSYTDPTTKAVYSYPSGVGTVVLTGKTSTGSSLLTVTTTSHSTDSVTIANGYDYLFSVDKTMISSTPDKVNADSTLLSVNYEVRPACAKIYVTVNESSTEAGCHVGLASSSFDSYDSSQRQWTISTHSSDEETASSGIAKGTIVFTVDGESNCTVNLRAVNENVVTSGTSTATAEEINSHNIKLQVCYSKHTFSTAIVKKVPYFNFNIYSNVLLTSYSKYDSATNTIFLGDGEYLNGTVTCNEKYSNVLVKGVSFFAASTSKTDGNGYTQSKRCEASCLSIGYNTASWSLFHSMDYGSVRYYTGSYWKKNSTFYNLSGSSEAATENLNETVKEKPYVGYLKVTYYNYSSNSDSYYNIPVYVEVRNCPCCSTTGYYYKAN